MNKIIRNQNKIKLLFALLIYLLATQTFCVDELWNVKSKDAQDFSLKIRDVEGILYVSMKDLINLFNSVEPSLKMAWDDQFSVLKISYQKKIYSLFKDRALLIADKIKVDTDYSLKVVQGDVLIPASSISLLNQYLNILEIANIPAVSKISSSTQQTEGKISIDTNIEFAQPDGTAGNIIKSDVSQKKDDFTIAFDSTKDFQISKNENTKILSVKEILKKATLEKPVVPKKIFIEPDFSFEMSNKQQVKDISPIDITNNIAKRIKEILLASGNIQVEIAQKRLNPVPLNEKVEQINSSGSDMFIMLGCDSAPTDRNSGIQIYSMHSAIDEEGQKFNLSTTNTGIPNTLSYLPFQNLNLILSGKIYDEIKNNVPVEVKGVRIAPIYLLKRAAMPSILVMIGYANNSKDIQLLSNIGFQEIIARSIAGGIINYSNLIQSLK